MILLDGDELREVFGAAAENARNHGREGRLALAMQYAHLCRVIAGQGLTVVIATISLFREVHEWNRANLPGYFEAYLKVPIETPAWAQHPVEFPGRRVEIRPVEARCHAQPVGGRRRQPGALGAAGQPADGGVAAVPAPLAITYDPEWRRLWERRFADPLSDAETFRVDATGKLLEIGQHPTTIEAIQGQYMGLLRFTPKGWAEVLRIRTALPANEQDTMHMTGTLQRIIASGRLPIAAIAYRGAWGEIDTEHDLLVSAEAAAPLASAEQEPNLSQGENPCSP